MVLLPAGDFKSWKSLIKTPEQHKPFSSQCSLLISLKISENQKFSDVFRGIKKEHWEEKG